MLHVREILGRAGEPRFRGRRVERVPVDWGEASKRRLRRRSDGGTDVAIDVPRGAYLADGAVLADDGTRVVVVERRREPALVVRLDPGWPSGELARAAVLIGHAFGNQHVPLEVEGHEIRIPLTTSEAVARGTVEGLGLAGLEIATELVALGCERPLPVGHAHGHHDHHDHRHG
jgi:urease accessory protein